MLADIKLSPPKGKARDDTHWHADWWDFYPLIERPQRPVVWTNTSVIFTAHSIQPWVTARIFSSSKQFVLPSPEPIFASPASYQPPTVISVSPADDWIFAFFPGAGGDGTGCLWKRGPQVDSWAVKDYWSFAEGAGVVTAAWLGVAREWVTDNTGSASRLPPRGPTTPISSPTLVIVTSDHQLNFCYIRSYMPSLKVMRCSLMQPSMVSETQPHSIQDVPLGPGGIKVCINASIGLAYNESSILVAMRSHLYPTPKGVPSAWSEMNLGLPLDISQQSITEQPPVVDWETWGEESTIDLCEIQLGFDGAIINLSTNPLPPIYHSFGLHLNTLSFVCLPPQSSWPAPTQSPTLFAKSSKDQKRVSEPQPQSQTYLAASFLDFGDNSSLPKSELTLYSFSRNPSVSNANKATWSCSRQTTRSFSSEVLAFFIPSVVTPGTLQVNLYAGMLDLHGTIPTTTNKSREMPVGRTVVLKLPDLSEDEEYDKSLIVTPAGTIIREIPLNAVVSPNNVLLAAVSPSLIVTRTSVHALPLRHPESSSGSLPVSYFTSALISAIHSRKSTADITHALSLTTTNADYIIDVLYDTFEAFEAKSLQGLSGMWNWEILGIAVEIYGIQARYSHEEDERRHFIAQRQTAHDLCSMAACNIAFEDCKEGETYDLEAVWQLISMSQWAINFAEKLVKECLRLCPTSVLEPSEDSKMDSQSDGEDLFGSAPATPAFESNTSVIESPILLHLGHPYALANLQNLFSHVKHFRDFLGAKEARGENAQIARDVLVDLVDCSGLEIDTLATVVAECSQYAQSISADDARRSLASCQPTPAMNTPIQKAVRKLSSTSVVDKARLFVKSSDLVDGISRMSIAEGPSKQKDRDIITKSLFTSFDSEISRRGAVSTCIRCGGESEVGGDIGVAGHISLRWGAWEKVWTLRCICGGVWAR